MPRTSRARRLTVVEPSPAQHETQEPPAAPGEVAQPDNADQADLRRGSDRDERVAAHGATPDEILQRKPNSERSCKAIVTKLRGGSATTAIGASVMLRLAPILHDATWLKLADEHTALCAECMFQRASERGVVLTLADLLPCTFNARRRPFPQGPCSWFDLFLSRESESRPSFSEWLDTE
jgi:hypothetical protein